MNQREKLQHTYNVIVRNDGVILRDEFGNYKLYYIGNEAGQMELDRLHEKCNKYKFEYRYKLVLYANLPEKDKIQLETRG
jgi:hypothetical protein